MSQPNKQQKISRSVVNATHDDRGARVVRGRPKVVAEWTANLITKHVENFPRLQVSYTRHLLGYSQQAPFDPLEGAPIYHALLHA